ncbi:D-alanyl-D-alanine carboxypeptidase [Roseibium sp.]|uniref:D-alanyl-D-alanine carboxypeptidase n=1 Tax=Roseibium sp. TaxID=1936156 RepID=UPI003A9762CC
MVFALSVQHPALLLCFPHTLITNSAKILGAVLAMALALSVGATTASAGEARLLMDLQSGQVLEAENADVQNYPASLTKMMTLYLTFEALKRGELAWDSRVPISKLAALTPPYKFALPEGATFTVREAVEGMIVISANDAAQSMCDYFGTKRGSGCGAVMTKKAHALGMSRTTFINGSGLHDPRQFTTARDMATLGMALIRDFPDQYHLFSLRAFTFRNMKLRGHNSLMYRYEGMDGLKTGFTDPSGYNLVSSAKRDGRRLVGVVLGAKNGADRASKMEAMMDAGFAGASRSKALMALAPDNKQTLQAANRAAENGAKDAAAILSGSIASPSGSADPAQSASLWATTKSALFRPLKAPEDPAQVTNASPPEPFQDDLAGSAHVAKTLSKLLPRAKPLSAVAKKAATAAPRASRIKTANAVSRSAWEVQVAAVDRPEAASTLLSQAKDVLGAKFAQIMPFTQTISRGSMTLIRARLTGFDTKASAEAACKLLQAKEKSCFVVGSKA